MALLCLLGLNASAQGDAFKKNFFSSWHLQGFSEYGTTAPLEYTNYQGKEVKEHVTYLNFLGVVYEPRFNVLSFSDKASVSIAAPLSARMNIGWEDEDFFIIGGLGTYADFNIGNRSTFNNIDGNGYALGVGMDFDKYFTGDVNGIVMSPMARLKVISLINSVYDAYFSVMIKAGIPVTYENQDGETMVGNQNYGLFLTLGF